MHRADLHQALLEEAKRVGVEVTGNQRVVSYDFEAPSVTVEGGEIFEADVVIGCDGTIYLSPLVIKIY